MNNIKKSRYICVRVCADISAQVDCLLKKLKWSLQDYVIDLIEKDLANRDIAKSFREIKEEAKKDDTDTV